MALGGLAIEKIQRLITFGLPFWWKMSEKQSAGSWSGLTTYHVYPFFCGKKRASTGSPGFLVVKNNTIAV